jgi:DNA-binding CsgD family transcriptional regulator
MNLEKIVFSSREKEILLLIADAFTSKQIALKLGLSKRTIDYYRTRLAMKLKIKGNAALIKAAIEFKAAYNKKNR